MHVNEFLKAFVTLYRMISCNHSSYLSLFCLVVMFC